MLAGKDKGSAVVDVVIAAAMVIFVILPVFSIAMEKYVLLEKSRIIRDAVDMTNISAYNAMVSENLGKANVYPDRDEVLEIYEALLCVNLNLNEGMTPGNGSVAEGRVEIGSLELYPGGIQAVCPNGAEIVRPTIHSCIRVPIQPSLYRRAVMELLGRDSIMAEVHVDSEIPLNN